MGGEKRFQLYSITYQINTNDTGKDLDIKDSGKKGLLLRVTPTGKKIFRLKAWNRTLKKTEQIVLGPFPGIGVQDALDMVDRMLRDMKRGG